MTITIKTSIKTKKQISMTLSDVTLLFKKILLGIVLIIIPLLILWLGIRFSIRFANRDQPTDSSNITVNTNK